MPDRSLIEPPAPAMGVTALDSPDTPDRTPDAQQTAYGLHLTATRIPYPSEVLLCTVAAKVPRPLAGWLHAEAARLNTTPSRMIRDWLTQLREDSPRWPADVEYWLLAQANQLDCPGDMDRAVIGVVRHLAKTWPGGARLAP